MTQLQDAKPSQHFAFPPYRAEEFVRGGAACVMNSRGLNVLTFASKPGAVLTDFKTAQEIADKWNKEASV